MKISKVQFLSAAVAGLVSASLPALADDAAKVSPNKKGACFGANACKGQTACNQKDHDCSGKNSCKGKGWLEKTKAECDALAKKDKHIKFGDQG